MNFLIALIVLIISPNFVQAENSEPDLVVVPDGNASSGAMVTEPNNTVYTATKGLTDQEYMLKKYYVHEGYQQRTYDEACKNNTKLCRGRELDHKFLGVDPAMVSALAKAYAAVIGAMGTKLTTNVSEKAKNGDVKKEYEDYCRFIAAGTETVGTAMQALENKHISDMPTTDTTLQRDALYKAALSHKSRAKTAKIQTVGWGSTTACYAYMLTQGVTIKSAGIKLAAAGLLTAFYNSEMSKYEEAEKKVKDIADSLPKKGACNPISETPCYCSQSETKNDPHYCVPPSLKKMSGEQEYVATCVDDKLESDITCKCEITDTCFDNKLKKISDEVKLASAYNGEIFNPLVAISKGNMKAASVNGNLGLKQAVARATSLMDQISRKFPIESTGLLSEKQENEAMTLEKMGVPSSLARNFAQSNAPSDVEKYAYKFSERNLKKDLLQNNELQYDLAEKNDTPKKNQKSGDSLDFLKNFGQKTKEQQPQNKYLYFSQKAEKEAQINQDRSDDIWKVISRRYQLVKKSRLE